MSVLFSFKHRCQWCFRRVLVLHSWMLSFKLFCSGMYFHFSMDKIFYFIIINVFLQLLGRSASCWTLEVLSGIMFLFPDPKTYSFITDRRWNFWCRLKGLCQAVSASLQQPVNQTAFPLSRCSAELWLLPQPWYFCWVTLSVCGGNSAACPVCVGSVREKETWFLSLHFNEPICLGV